MKLTNAEKQRAYHAKIQAVKHATVNKEIERARVAAYRDLMGPYRYHNTLAGGMQRIYKVYRQLTEQEHAVIQAICPQAIIKYEIHTNGVQVYITIPFNV